MKILPFLLRISAVIFLTCTPSFALESFGLYDNFSFPPLSPLRWQGSEDTSTGTEIIRGVINKKLLMNYRAYGSSGSNVGVQTSALSLSLIRNTDLITALKGTLRITGFSTVGCEANTASTSGRMGMQGAFFNAGSPVTGNSTNDVRAGIGVVSSSTTPDTLTAVSFVYQCLNSLCSSLGIIDVDNLGSVNVDTDTILQMQWDPDNNQFLFSMNNGTPVVSPYGAIPDSTIPGRLFHRLEIVHAAENCTATIRPRSFLSGTFDNILVNASAF